MKYLIWFLFISAIVSIFLGISIPDSDAIDSATKAQEIAVSEKLIGFGVLGLFFVVFPLFSYHRWKDKKVADYMLNQENIEKMNAFNNKKE